MALRIGSGWRGDIEQADKDIHEHQLGWRWRAPSDQIFIELGSDILLKAEEEKVEVAPEVVDDLAITMRKEIYSTLLATLCSEAFFLVDEKTREKLPSLSPSLQDWVQCQSILQALGVQNGASLEKLRISLAGRGEMSHNCIDKKLVSFLEEAQAADDNSQESSEPEYDPRGPPGTKLTKKDIIKLKWENYWRSFTTVINAKVFRIWGILEQALIAYNRLLKERKLITSEVISLREQNAALRQALHQCLNKV